MERASHPASQLRNYILVETMLSAVANTVIGFAAFWIVFGLDPHVPLWGSKGIALDLVPTIFMMTLMCTIVPTVLTRRRVRRGVIQFEPLGRNWRLPQNVLVRAAFHGAALTLVLFPIAVAALRAVGPQIWTLWPLLIFKTIFGVLIAAIATPVAIRQALHDRHRA